MTKNKFTIKDVEQELRRRIENFDKYRLEIGLSHGIITVECKGVGVYGYETGVDTGDKTFEEVVNELTPKVIRLIKTCKEKSP